MKILSYTIYNLIFFSELHLLQYIDSVTSIVRLLFKKFLNVLNYNFCGVVTNFPNNCDSIIFM